MYSALEFDVAPANAVATSLDDRGPWVVVPVVDGIALTRRVQSFQAASGIATRDPRRDDYGGLIPAHFRSGSARTHWFAREDAFVDGAGRVPVLGCWCGEWGCWPLLARIEVTRRAVTWSGFRQPSRSERSYEGFGPFVFRRRAYERAVERLAGDWEDGAG